METRMRVSTFFTVVYVGLFLAHNGHALLPSEEVHIVKLPDETPPTHGVKFKKSQRKGNKMNKRNDIFII